MDNTTTQKGKSVESYIRIYVATILVLWKSICDDSKTQSKKKKDEEEKRIKEEKKESDDIAKGITLVEDEELEIEEIAKERKEGIELIKNTRFKKKYEEYKTCENELKTDLDAMQQELTTIYDECEEIISTQTDKTNVNKKKKEELEAQIKLIINTANELFRKGKNKFDKDKFKNLMKKGFDILEEEKIPVENKEITQPPADNDEDYDIDNIEKDLSERIKKNNNSIKLLEGINKNTNTTEELINRKLKELGITSDYDGEKVEQTKTKIEALGREKIAQPANRESIIREITELQTEIDQQTNKLSNFNKLKENKIEELRTKTRVIEDAQRAFKKGKEDFNTYINEIKTIKREIKKLIGLDDIGKNHNKYFEEEKTVFQIKIENLHTEINTNKYSVTSDLYKKLNELELHKETEQGTDTNPVCTAINKELDKFKNNYNPQVFEIIKNEIFKDEYYKYDYFDKKIIDDMLDKQIIKKSQSQEDKKENIKLMKEYAQQHIEVIEEYIEKTEKNQRKISIKENETEKKEGLTYYLDDKLNKNNTFKDIISIFNAYDIRKEDKNVVLTDDKKEDWIIINEYLKKLKKIRRNETLDPYKIEDIFNRDKKYEKDNYFLLTKDKQEMYETFSDYIKDPVANIQKNNNFGKFKTEIEKNIKQSLDEDSLEEQTTNQELDNFIKSFIDIPTNQQGGVKNVIKGGATGAETVTGAAVIKPEKSEDWIALLISAKIEPRHKNYKKWIERKKKLVQLRKNLKKNISEIFKKRFSLIKLVYFVIKNSNEINNWKILVKNNKIKSNRILTNSVKKRIKLIQKINDKMYTDLLLHEEKYLVI